MSTVSRTTILVSVLTAASLVLMLGPWGAKASAACPKASVPAYKMPSKGARKATLCLINKQRAKRGMPKLKQDRKATKAAKRHTKVMIAKRCFSHLCPGERDLVGRLTSANYLPCKCSWGVGENLAYGHRRQSSPAGIVKAWMKSPSHRANILKRSFRHIGIGVKDGSPSGGGKAATYTTVFGYRN